MADIRNPGGDCWIPAAAFSTIYVRDEGVEHNRYIASLIVGYGDDDKIVSSRQAVAAAIHLVLQGNDDNGSPLWHVYDRVTQQRSFVSQSSVIALVQEMS